MNIYQQNHLAHVNPGSTAYTAGTDVFTAVALPIGSYRLVLSFAVDAAVIPIIRLNGVNINLNAGAAVVAGAGYVFEYAAGASDTNVAVRFSGNCNILHLHFAWVPA